MDAVIQVVLSGLTLGAMYALGSIGLALTYGTMRMFNMAHGMFMTLGAYSAYTLAGQIGLPPWLSFPGGVAFAGLVAGLMHLAMVRHMLGTRDFEINILVATAGAGMLLQDIVLKTYGAYPFAQPVQIEGVFRVLGSSIPYQSVAILVLAAILLGGLGLILTRTRFGLSIRATAMNREAAQLMGVRTERTYLAVLLMAGALAGAAGVMISSLSTLSPEMGTNPAVRAFVICVVAGLGSIPGAGVAAISLGLFEALVQFYVGARYGLPLMLGLVITVLIFRPAGLFGRREVVRS